jgi:hypothetical protein
VLVLCERVTGYLVRARDTRPEERGAAGPNHVSRIGAVILGRRMAGLGIGPWGEEPTFHAPCFVVTQRPAETIVKKGGTSYSFVTDGIEAAFHRKLSLRHGAGLPNHPLHGSRSGRRARSAGRDFRSATNGALCRHPPNCRVAAEMDD